MTFAFRHRLTSSDPATVEQWWKARPATHAAALGEAAAKTPTTTILVRDADAFEGLTVFDRSGLTAQEAQQRAHDLWATSGAQVDAGTPIQLSISTPVPGGGGQVDPIRIVWMGRDEPGSGVIVAD